MLQDFLIPFLTIGLAELGDKTQFAILSLAAKTKHHIELFLGSMLAFLAADGLAIFIGNFLPDIIPLGYVKLFTGLLFILFGLLALRQQPEEKKNLHLRSPIFSTFALVFLLELGDKSQIAAALFAATYRPWLVLLGVLLALATLSLFAIWAGKLIRDKLQSKVVHYLSAGIFIAVGIWVLLTA